VTATRPAIPQTEVTRTITTRKNSHPGTRSTSELQPHDGAGTHQKLPFLSRLGLHLAILVATGFAVFLAGGSASPQTLEGGSRSGAAAWRPSIPSSADILIRPPLGVAGGVATAAQAPPVGADPVRLPKGTTTSSAGELQSDDSTTGASIQFEALGQVDGLLAERAMPSSRGEARPPATSQPPTPSPTPTAAPKKEALKPQSYRVVAGDTLLAIAYRLGVTPETILWANDLGNGETLQIDDVLTIPPVSGVLHKVKNGDTTLSIANTYGAEVGSVVDANQLENADALQEGQLLVVPGGMMRTTEPITAFPSAPSREELARAPKYRVKNGDTLLSIADAFAVRASVIQVSNNLLDPGMLNVGQELSIPGGNPQAAPAPAPRPQPATPVPAPKPAPTPKPAPAPVQLVTAPEPISESEAEAEPAPSPGSGGDRIAAIAQKYLGNRYVWGGHSPSGFDCSGFTWYVYKEAGISIPLHDLAGQLNSGKRISRDQLLPGDLVLFQNTYKPGLSHSGIYLGGGRFINAETEAVGVQVRSLSDPYWSPRFVGGSRPW
jgi:peptidoglycan DL-endopeptidase LytE